MSEPPACGHSFSPLDVLAAIAMALVAASSERPSAKLPASAAPIGATSPVGRYKRARSELTSARPIRAPVSYPMMAAVSSRPPCSGVCSDSARRVGQITTPWCAMLAACMSSRTRPCPITALAKAASAGEVGCGRPTIVALPPAFAIETA
ncbi:hypothetical protein ACVWYI_002743 [Bradyrhizobium sp. LB13.1]